MTKEPIWLGLNVIKAIHRAQIHEHGGHLGIRDEQLIASALARPKHHWHYKNEQDLPSLAAIYGYGLTQNHGFIDGNKRVAFMAMYTFLAVNGYRMIAPELEVVEIMINLAQGEITEENLANWLRKNIMPIQSQD